ncbi:MAG: hypothetical protein Q7S65_05605 [Nanoarchaeota archaeon]|nr:hypothetical protein [Nanoarchaeota archaeon]
MNRPLVAIVLAASTALGCGPTNPPTTPTVEVAKAESWDDARVVPIEQYELATRSWVYQQANDQLVDRIKTPAGLDTLTRWHDNWVRKGMPYSEFNADLLAMTVYAQAPREILAHLSREKVQSFPGFRDMEQRIDQEYETIQKQASANNWNENQVAMAKIVVIEHAAFNYTRSVLKSSGEGTIVGLWAKEGLKRRLEAKEGNCIINTCFFYEVVNLELQRANLARLKEAFRLRLGIRQEGDAYLHMWAYEGLTKTTIELNDKRDDALFGVSLSGRELYLNQVTPGPTSYIPITQLVPKTNKKGVPFFEVYAFALSSDVRKDLETKK